MNDMHPADITDLANTVAELIMERLGQSVVSSVIPADIVEHLKEQTRGYPHQILHVIPVGSDGFMSRWSIAADGVISLELSAMNGRIFWRGQFRIEAA